jgi:hemolysin activation/secretion protein
LPRANPQALPSGSEPKPAFDSPVTAKIQVTGIKFSGNTEFGQAQLEPLVSSLIGKSVSLDELTAAARSVRQYYRDRGYLLAQAYLPRQDVTKGLIEIIVLEGYVGKFTATATKNARLKPEFAQGVLNAGIKSGQVITEKALEKPLLILSDLPGVDVKSAISAGAAVGTADLDVTIDQQIGSGALAQATGGIANGGVEFDNHGSRSTGQYRLGANVAINNLTGYGDQLSMRAQVSVENTRTNFAYIGWQTPLGYQGTQASLSFSKLNYALIGTFAALQAEGDAAVTTLIVSHPLVRSRNLNASAYGAYENKRIEDRVLTVNSVETRHIDNLRAGLRGDWRDTLLGGGLSTYNLAVTAGKLRIDQAPAIANDQGAFGPKTIGHFNKFNLDLLRLQTVSNNLNVLTTLKSQWASKNLTSSEKLTLGGPNEVRAYPVGEASGDQGYVGTLEARYTNPDWRIANAATVLSAFYDFGSISINKIPLAGAANKRSLQGAGLGLTVAHSAGLSLRAAMAWRVGSELPKSDRDRSPRFWLHLNWAL